MDISLTCQCGKRYSVATQHAGKPAKCPACGVDLLVPEHPSQRGVDAGAQEEYGLQTPIAREELRCAVCNQPMQAGQTLCVECGYNFKTGQRVSAVKHLAEDDTQPATDWRVLKVGAVLIAIALLTAGAVVFAPGLFHRRSSVADSTRQLDALDRREVETTSAGSDLSKEKAVLTESPKKPSPPEPPPEEMHALEVLDIESLFAKERMNRMQVETTDKAETHKEVVHTHTERYSNANDPTGLVIERNGTAYYKLMRLKPTRGRAKERTIIDGNGRAVSPDVPVDVFTGNVHSLYLGPLLRRTVTVRFFLGKPLCVGGFAEGKRAGLWASFYENGVPRVAGNYTNGMRNGQFICNYKSGLRHWEGQYENNHLVRAAVYTEKEAVRGETAFLRQLMDLLRHSPGLPSPAVMNRTASLMVDAAPPLLPKRSLDEAMALMAGELDWNKALARAEAALIPKSSVPPLVAKSPDREMMEIAIALFLNQGDVAVDQLVKYFQKLPVYGPGAALGSLQSQGVVPPHPVVAVAMQKLGAKAKPTIPAILDCLKCAHRAGQPPQTTDAIWSLLADVGPAAVPDLVEFVKQCDDQFDPDPRSLLPLDSMHTKSYYLYTAVPPYYKMEPAIKALSVLGKLPRSKETMAFLSSAAKKPPAPPMKRPSKATSRGQRNPAQGLPRPSQQSRSILDSTIVQIHLAGTLAKFDPGKGVPLLAAHLREVLSSVESSSGQRDTSSAISDSSHIMIRDAVRFLREAGPEAKVALPTLRSILKKVPNDETIAEVQLTVEALAKMSGGDSDTGAASAGPKARVFRDSTGKFSVEATFVRLENGNVVLKRKDGKQVQVPLSQLSKEDQAWVAKQEDARPD
jgi:hypothetical protein